MEKVRVYCQRRFSRQSVIQKLSFYVTRLTVTVVWCGVLWAFLANDALPRQYVEYLQTRTPKPCVVSSMNIPIKDRDQLHSVLPSSWNDSLFNGDYQLVSTSDVIDDNSSYQVLLIRQSNVCLNVLEFKGFTVLTPSVVDVNGTISGSGEGDAATESLATGSIDILQLLYPDMSTTLLDIPVGHFFALTLLLIVSSIFGVVAKWIFLPPLVGMIIAGFILRNVPGIDFARHISTNWSSTLRNVALVLVLTRGGLSMDIKQLKRLKFAVLLLAFLPCVLEGAVDGMLATFWLRLPWQFAFTLGYIIAAISPAVVVPTTLNLQSQGYGKESGIPTLIVAAASMDVVISISLFGIFLGLSFSEGNLIIDIFRAPIQIIVGLLYGTVCGLLLWIFPSKHSKSGSKIRNRFFLTFGLGLFSLFGSTHAVIGGANLAGSGALGVLVLAFVAGQGWNKDEKKRVSRVFLIVWQFFEPLLFGLIGAAVDLQFISPSLVGQGIGLIVIGLVLRISVSYVVVLGNGFSWLEMCFVATAWLPKATVQAAIGSLALDLARVRNNNDEDAREVQFGRQILTIAVLAVVLTAPLGALATSLLGPVLLKKSTDDESDSNKSLPVDVNEVKEFPPTSPHELRENHSGPHNGDIHGDNIELNAVVVRDMDSEPTAVVRGMNSEPTAVVRGMNSEPTAVVRDMDSEPNS